MPYYMSRKPSKGGKGTRSSAVDKADRQFSRFIRLRDAIPGGAFKCISCGKFKRIEQADCGHFHSRKHMATRFDELNAHAECRACNRFSADHLIKYQENLIRLIGEEEFGRLNIRAKGIKQWSETDLKELAKYYKALADRLSKEKGINI